MTCNHPPYEHFTCSNCGKRPVENVTDFPVCQPFKGVLDYHRSAGEGVAEKDLPDFEEYENQDREVIGVYQPNVPLYRMNGWKQDERFTSVDIGIDGFLVVMFR